MSLHVFANIVTCEPTAHRAVWRVVSPPPHALLESRLEPTLATPAGVTSDRLGPVPASPGADDGSRPRGRAACGYWQIPGVSRVGRGAGLRTPAMRQGQQPGDQRPRTASTSATNLHDALSFRHDRICTMRCRENLHDVLSVRR